IPTVDGKRVAAIEILLGTPMIRDLIMKGDVHAIKEIIEKSEEQGMQTFDSHLYKLYLAGQISLAETLRNADSPSNLKLKINLSGNLNKPRPTAATAAPAPEMTLALQPKPEAELT
ncbi:MAG: type IV pili twitching motility protein PilT, partial [Thiothrix lacustris]